MPIHWTQDPAADELLERDPLALLIGLVLDQQVRMEMAFSAPYRLQERIGHLDPARIAGMDPDELEAVFRQRPVLHRFPGSMARRVQAFCAAVAADYGGDVTRIWSEAKDGHDLARRIGRLPGFGAQKTKITIAVLAKRLNVKPEGWEAEAANWHSIADVDSPESMAEAREVKRQMKAQSH